MSSDATVDAVNTQTTHAVDEKLPGGKLLTLGLQHVLVMYAGAIAVPLIVGRVLQLTPEQVAFLISADLFVCGVVTIKAFPLIHEVYPAAAKKFQHSSGEKRSQISPMACMS